MSKRQLLNDVIIFYLFLYPYKFLIEPKLFLFSLKDVTMSCLLLVLLYTNVCYIIMFAPLYNVYQYYHIMMYRLCKFIQCFYYLLYRFIYEARVAIIISCVNTVFICVILSSGVLIKLTLFHDGTT